MFENVVIYVIEVIIIVYSVNDFFVVINSILCGEESGLRTIRPRRCGQNIRYSSTALVGMLITQYYT